MTHHEAIGTRIRGLRDGSWETPVRTALVRGGGERVPELRATSSATSAWSTRSGRRSRPYCVPCALAAAGVRSNAANRPVMSKREIRRRQKERRRESQVQPVGVGADIGPQIDWSIPEGSSSDFDWANEPAVATPEDMTSGRVVIVLTPLARGTCTARVIGDPEPGGAAQPPQPRDLAAVVGQLAPAGPRR